MAGISEPLLGAGASAKNDWAGASAATSLTFSAQGQIRRGVDVEIGLNALATADAGLSRFIDATVRGNAFAEATAGLQYQLPLNLFEQFGVTVGAQAVAQAAAGIEVGLGLSVGDFLNLIVQNGDAEGAPLEIVKLLLDEAVLGGTFEVHVAAAAMAYAEVVIAGQLTKDPGFNITADAGLGLAAGVGFSGGLHLGIRDFRRFYGRAIDRTLETVVDEIHHRLGADAETLVPILHALVPVASTTFRVAYEIGDYLSNPATRARHDQQGEADLCNHCVGIVLEEAQRFLFRQFADAGLRGIERLVNTDVPNLGQGVWDRLMPERQALASVLRHMPTEPFQPTSDNAAYWADLVDKTIALIAGLPVGEGGELLRGLAIVYAAAELLREATKNRVNQKKAYAFAIGAGTAATTQPRFTDPLAPQPPAKLATHINQVLGLSGALTYPKLLAYLVEDAAIATLRSASPGIDRYLSIFDDPRIASGMTEVIAVLLENNGAFLDDANGNRDPRTTLAVILDVLDVFMADAIATRLLPAVNEQITDGNVRLYFNEVIVGTLLYGKEIAFATVLSWEQEQGLDESAFKEALAAVITMLLGRSLVLVGDSFMAALQGDMRRACAHAADNMDGPRNPFRAMNIPVSPELKALIADTLRIGGEVFGPLPADVRRNLRFVLYDVMETLPPTAAARADILANLSDQFFIPNQDSLHELSDQLLAIARDRFQLFVERVLESGAQLVLAQLRAFLEEATRVIEAWLAALDQALRDLREDILRLAQAIHGLVLLTERAFEAATDRLEDVVHDFGSSTFRHRLRDRIAEAFYEKGKSALAELPFYHSLPSELRRAVKRAMRHVIDDLVGNAVLDVALTAIGSIAGELDDVLEDVRELNPSRPLAPQLLDLLIDRMEDRVRDAFGGSKPHLNIGFDAHVFGVSHHFSLGRVELKFSTLFSILRNAIHALHVYEANLNAAAAALAEAFARSLDLEEAQTDHDRKVTERDRLAVIRDESSANPKTITVVNPVQSLIYDDDLSVEIHLGGVPASYLGLHKDEQQRAFIFLNGALIPPAGIALDDVFADLDSAHLHEPIDVMRLPTFNAGSASIVGKTSGIALRAAPRVAARPAPSTTAGAPPLRRSLQATTTGRATASSRPVVTRRYGNASDAPVTSDRLGNVLAGRRMPPTKRDVVTESLPPGIAVTFDVGVERLVVGTNTLAVIVIDPGGQQYQQVVSFGVVAVAESESAGAILPTLPAPRSRLSGTPAKSDGKIDLHFQAAAVAKRLETSRAFVAQQARVRLRGLEAVKPVSKADLA